MSKFTKLTDLINKVRRLDNQMIMQEVFSIKAVQEKVISLNQGQLRNFIDSKGEKIISEAGNPIDLYETGAFYDTFKVKITGNTVDIVANTAIYGDDFKDKYSPYILGLTDASLKELQAFILPYVRNYLMVYLSATR